MERLTQKQADGSYAAVDSEANAMQRLGRFEDFVADMEGRQQTLADQLEELRATGKKNSARFKELLGQKLMESNTLVLLKTYGIE